MIGLTILHVYPTIQLGCLIYDVVYLQGDAGLDFHASTVSSLYVFIVKYDYQTPQKSLSIKGSNIQPHMNWCLIDLYHIVVGLILRVGRDTGPHFCGNS